jgi:hypothetical protein
MFGKIKNEQNIQTNKNFGKLLNNPKFVAVSNKISEESLYNLIQNYFDKNDKEKLLKNCNLYLKYNYKKYIDLVNKYIQNT